MTQSVKTPDWVKDAVFYQIFPDRFAQQRARDQTLEPGAVGQPADAPRLQGRRPAGRGRASRLPGRPGDHRDLLSTRSSSRRPITATTRTTTTASTRCWAAMTRCASCSTRPTRAVSGSCSTACSTTPAGGSSSSTTSWNAAPARPTWIGSPSRGFPLRRLLTRRREQPNYDGLVGPARAAQAQHRQPAGARVHLGRGRATGSSSASMAGGWTCPQRSTTTRSGRNSAAG